MWLKWTTGITMNERNCKIEYSGSEKPLQKIQLVSKLNQIEQQRISDLIFNLFNKLD